MNLRLTEMDAWESLSTHAAAKGEALRSKYGPDIDWRELLLVLQDNSLVRYPCGIVFDDRELLPGEVAFSARRSERPEAGFIIFLHPYFSSRRSVAPYPVLYQLAVVNYGEVVSPAAAEAFGAAALGLTRDEYYRRLCELVDAVVGEEVEP